jgi:hypothetical protein
MSLTYGYDPKEGDDMIATPVQAAEIISPLLLPGAALVNHFPFCAVIYCILPMLVRLRSFSVKHVPSWVPWLSYEPLGKKVRVLSEKMRNDPINFVKNAMVRLHHAPTAHVV